MTDADRDALIEVMARAIYANHETRLGAQTSREDWLNEADDWRADARDALAVVERLGWTPPTAVADLPQATRPVTDEQIVGLVMKIMHGTANPVRVREIVTAINAIRLPPGSELAEFAPCVHENRELGFTEMILRDCQTMWAPLEGVGPGHVVDLGYDPDGSLVGIKIWARVAYRITGEPTDG